MLTPHLPPPVEPNHPDVTVLSPRSTSWFLCVRLFLLPVWEWGATSDYESSCASLRGVALAASCLMTSKPTDQGRASCPWARLYCNFFVVFCFFKGGISPFHKELCAAVWRWPSAAHWGSLWWDDSPRSAATAAAAAVQCSGLGLKNVSGCCFNPLTWKI